MANYKKGLISIAAALAMSTSAANADYLPLANAALDDEWMLFGASGFLTDGAVAAVAGSFTIDAAYTLTDTYTGDELFETSGLTVGAGDMATLKALNAANDPIEIRLDTTGATFNETEPTRTIYVDTDGDGVGDFAFTYKAQLEGSRLEYSVNSGDVYFLTVDYANTYDNPATGTYINGTPAQPGTALDDLVDLGDGTLIDYDFANNPINYLNYDGALVADGGHRDVADNSESLRLYSYDANDGGLWSLFDSRYANSANDFLSLEKGRGYWGKLDMAGDAGDLAGLVLGSDTIAAADYQALNLTDGWNLLSFNKGNYSELRHANTGLLLTLNGGSGATVAGTFTIKDSSGNQTVSVTMAGGETYAEVARLINFAVAQAKAQGTIPKTFDLKAFDTHDGGATQYITLVSNKKFSVYDNGGDALIDTVRNMTGGDVINPTTDAVITGGAANSLTADGAASIYGEYMMVIEALPVDNATGDLINDAALNAKSQLETVAGGTDSTINLITDLPTATQAIDGTGGLRAYQIDIDQDATYDHIIVASDEPFYLRDQTFARVFTYDDSGTAGTITITGAGGQDVASITIPTGSTADAVAALIDDASGAIQADVDASGNIVIVSTDSAGSEFAVYHTGGGDNLSVASSNDAMAQGSVADVYSITNLAQKAINNVVTATLTDGGAGVAAAGETVDITISTFHNAALALGQYTTVAGDTVPATFYTNLVAHINTELAANGLDATATGAATGAVNPFDGSIVISGADVYGTTVFTHSTGVITGAFAAVNGAINTTSMAGDLASDLKYNAVYTPNYVIDGPLYTIREAGFDLKALVTGTMPMDGVSTMQWDSIDLTRVPSEWFTSQDYNLFDTDEQAGYWAYLETNEDPNPLTIGNISLSPLDYVHYYDGATTTNAFSTNIKVEVNGIDETRDPDTVNGGSKSARVTATIGGKRTELTRESQNLYSGKINFYEVEGVNANTAFTIIIDAADGLGNKVTTTTSVIDNQKPTAPTASFDGSNITISSTTPDVARYYVFDSIIPENYNSGDELLYLDNEPDGEVIGSGVCGNDVTISSTAGSLKVVAVDDGDGNGTGEIYKGNVSNSTSIAYMAIAKDRVVLTDINNNEIEMSVGGTPYDDTCTAGTAVTTNEYAMQLASMTNTKTAKIAFTEMASGVDLTGTPITVYVRNNANDAVAKITYAPAYVGEEVFVMLNGVVYGYTLDDRATAEATTPTSGIDLSAEVPGGLKTGVTF